MIYSTKDEARQDALDYTQMLYNRKRRHGFNRGLSPIKFEKRHFCAWGVSRRMVAIQSHYPCQWFILLHLAHPKAMQVQPLPHVGVTV